MPEIEPIPMLLWCPACHERHVDAGEFATRVHHSHACQTCGLVWRPAIVPTVGVQFLPGFKDEHDPSDDPSYQAHVQSAAKHCRCCSECHHQVPCAGTLAGGICDQMCSCDHDNDDAVDDWCDTDEEDGL